MISLTIIKLQLMFIPTLMRIHILFATTTNDSISVNTTGSTSCKADTHTNSNYVKNKY